MKDLKTYIILGLFACVILMYTCNSSPIIPDPEIKVVTRVDSIYVTDTISVWKYHPVAEVPEIENDSDDHMDLSDTSVLHSDTNIFYYGKKDSSLHYNIKVFSKEKPVKVQMDYSLLETTIHDSIYIRDSVDVTRQIKKSFLSAGATVIGGRNSFGFAPTLTYSHKKGNNYSIGYDIINGTVMIGFTKKISFKLSSQ